MTTVRDLLQEGKHRLRHFEAARLEAEILLARTMGVGRAHLFAHPGQEVADDIADQYLAAVKRRQHGEPMAYITGEREFWSLPFKVSPDVLIPRPETETLVESALARIPQECSMRIADIGTGSGAIALALAHERPECEIHATDISEAALKVAAENARNLNLGNVHFHSGSWFEPLCGQFDLVVSNPPYLAQDDRHLDEDDLPFEPDGALISGPDGLEGIRALCTGAHEHLKPGGWLGFEHGHDQAGASEQIMKSAEFIAIEQVKDLQAITRITWGMVPET